MLKGNLLYGQSGGPTAVINSSAIGLINEAKKHEEIETIYCCHYGIEGLLNDDLIDVTSISQYYLNKIKSEPGAYFGSCRYRISKEEDYERILEMFKKYNIRYFFYNGGNDSMDTCDKISKYLESVGYECRVIGIPKTVDNDLVITDHTPGFGSAANYVCQTLFDLVADLNSYKNGRVTIVEVMGRNAGWLTAASIYVKHKTGLPHLIYVPEVPFDMYNFLKNVEKIYKNEKKCLVVVSEGIKDEKGKLLAEGRIDAFGHSQLGGVGSYLASLVESRLDLKTRAIELNLMQRCSTYLRSKQDDKEAYECGKEALLFALEGKSDVMVANKTIMLKPYKYKYIPVPLSEVANGVKELDKKYLTNKEGTISLEYLDYVKRFINL